MSGYGPLDDSLIDKINQVRSVMPSLEKMHKAGNLPGVASKLLENYDLIRAIVLDLPDFNKLNNWISSTRAAVEEMRAGIEKENETRHADLEEFENRNPLYQYLRDCGKFYDLWLAIQPENYWCGVPPFSYQHLNDLGKAIKKKHPNIRKKVDIEKHKKI